MRRQAAECAPPASLPADRRTVNPNPTVPRATSPQSTVTSTLPFESLPLEAGSTTSLVTYLAEPATPSHDGLALLASWATTGATPNTRPSDQTQL